MNLIDRLNHSQTVLAPLFGVEANLAFTLAEDVSELAQYNPEVNEGVTYGVANNSGYESYDVFEEVNDFKIGMSVGSHLYAIANPNLVDEIRSNEDLEISPYDILPHVVAVLTGLVYDDTVNGKVYAEDFVEETIENDEDMCCIIAERLYKNKGKKSILELVPLNFLEAKAYIQKHTGYDITPIDLNIVVN